VPTDTDGDGMPDAWEDANGLDKRDGRDHGRTMPSGYTAIEAYLDERARQAMSTHLEGRGETIVVLGASYARGWPVHEIAGRRVVNKGVGGEQSGEMLGRFDKDVIAPKPKSVILWGFINDIHRSPPGDVDATLARTRSNIVEMVRLARLHGVRPILATEVTIRPPAGLANTVAGWIARLRGKRSYAEGVNEHVIATNRWIREYAKEQGLAVLDFQSVLSDADGMRASAYAVEDGSHLSPAAYARLTEQAEATLAALLDR
jgi:lysophospholipase L1-like esterase